MYLHNHDLGRTDLDRAEIGITAHLPITDLSRTDVGTTDVGTTDVGRT
jgi:hypothetical protein